MKAFDKKIKECVQGLKKSDIVEMKSLKSPPNALVLVSEAICILYSVQPNFNNFIKLISETDVISLLNNLDKENISDYSMEKLEKYIQMPDYTSEYITKVSKPAGLICQWTINVYQYAKLASSVINIASFLLTKYLNIFKHLK